MGSQGRTVETGGEMDDDWWRANEINDRRKFKVECERTLSWHVKTLKPRCGVLGWDIPKIEI
jgi:hypothetical protein